jgi:hypothetical protein
VTRFRLQGGADVLRSVVAACGVVATMSVVLGAAQASAYRPPARVLFQKAMERQFDRATKTLRIDVETQQFELSGAPRGPAASEKWSYEAPGNFRRDSDAGVEVRVDGRGKAAPDFLLDQVTSAPPLDPDRAVERFFHDMAAVGVNTEVVSFARFDGRIAYLIGSKPWENDKPQVWLDKDSLLVVRVVTLVKGDDGKLHRNDVRYLGWGAPLVGNWFPSTIEWWSDDHLVKRATVRNVERGVSFEAGTFSK